MPILQNIVRLEPEAPVRRPMSVEDRFSAFGMDALQFLLRSLKTREEAARVMEVGTGTVSRWASEGPNDPFLGRRSPKSWRSIWAGYPSPLPAYDRVFEKMRGRPFLDLLLESRPAEVVLAELREEGLSLLSAGNEEQVREACRRLQIPASSVRRWLVTTWPSKWAALDRLAREVCGKGWPEFVLSYEPDRVPIPLPPPALAELTRPLLGKIKAGSS